MRTLIKHATVVLPSESRITSLLVEDQKILDLDPPENVQADTVIDGTGKVLLPGVIDDQVHFREPGLTHKEDLWHASRACAKGGTTSFLEMPNTVPNTITQTALNEKLAIADKSSVVNYGFYIGATLDNVDDLKHATRTPGIKIFIGSSTGNLLVDEQSALEKIFADTTLPICAHCEDETTVRANAEKYAQETDIAFHSKVRDHRAAVIATTRAIDLATRHDHNFHVLHVSTADEIQLIANAARHADGSRIITAEVCPHHLFFNIDDYARLGSLVKMNPSIKTAADNAALWQALLDGHIQVIATDHAPHTMEEKRKPYPECPSGLPAVENSLLLILDQVNRGNCSLVQVADWMSAQPAKVWNIANKGKIEVGYDADLVLVDMNAKTEIRNEDQVTKCGWTPWDGETLNAKVCMTWVNGELVYSEGKGSPKAVNCNREIEFSSP